MKESTKEMLLGFDEAVQYKVNSKNLPNPGLRSLV